MSKLEFSCTVDLVYITDGDLIDAPISEIKKALTKELEKRFRGDNGFDKATVKNLKVFVHEEG